ncbi:MAG: CheY-like chemotaxis protein/HPt (histidine-containing phosphotransfer) domain-containing protein [Oleiphilaceae bacterium]
MTNEHLITLSKVDKLMCWAEDTRILLVDDNHINQLVAQRILNYLGLQADIGNNGKEAIASLMLTHNTLPYTLVLMDCQMPEMDGYEATQAIRAGEAGDHYRAIPIVAMTANAMQGDRDKCLAAGMDDYLSKPVNPDELLSKLKQYLKFSVGVGPKAVSVQTINDTLSVGALDQQRNTNDIKGSNDLTWGKEGALVRIGGNEALLKTLTGIFARDGLKQLAELKAAISEGNYQKVTHIAHSIKGVAANLGGLKLQSVSSIMELAAKNKDDAVIKAQTQEFEDQMKALINAFVKYLNNDDAGMQNKDSAMQCEAKVAVDEFIEILSVLYKSLAANDYIDPTELTALSHADVSKEVQALVNELVEKIKQFENSTAMTMVKDIELLSGFDILPSD